MKSFAAPTVMLAVVCLLAAACSPPKDEDRDAGSSPPGERSPSPFVDPWKAASDWPVPRGPVGEAQHFLLAAPAYQYKSEGQDLNTHRRYHGEARVVRNEALWFEAEGPYGKNGIFTDGKREFVFFQGRYEEEHGDSAATLRDQLKLASLQSLLDHCEEHTPFLGTGNIDGTEVEIYALNAPREDIQRGMVPAWAMEGGHLWVWIARDNHRPLRIEWKENRRDPQRPGATLASVNTRTYSYDPNVKVALPK